MAKTFNSIAQKAIARVNATIPTGRNWTQANSCNAALIIAEEILVGERAADDDRKKMMAALNDVINPSALAQAMAKLPETDACYRPRVSDLLPDGEIA